MKLRALITFLSGFWGLLSILIGGTMIVATLTVNDPSSVERRILIALVGFTVINFGTMLIGFAVLCGMIAKTENKPAIDKKDNS